MKNKKNVSLMLMIFTIIITLEPKLISSLTTFGKTPIQSNTTESTEYIAPKREPIHHIGAINGISNLTEFNENFVCIKDCEFINEPPKNCRDAMSNNIQQRVDGVYLLAIPYFKGLSPFGAYCERYGKSGWTIIQRRQDGSEDFNRDWSDYRNGFGDLNGEYWLGLERIFAMTAYRRHELMILWQNVDGEERYARYSQFNIASEEEDYRLSVSGYSGDADDSLDYYNNMKFSTKDRVEGEKCAAIQKSGWWHNNCQYKFRFVSLNGEYRNYTWRGEGIYWFHDENFHTLKYVHMAIRPRYKN